MVGAEFLDRHGIRGDGNTSGMVDDFAVFDSSRCESGRVHPSIRRFYEQTADYTLDIRSSWSRGFKFGARLYACLSRRIQQLNFPRDGLDDNALSSRIAPVEDAADGRDDVRAWIRAYEETGDTIYVALYSTHTFAGRPYMNIAFPLPWTNLTSILSVERLGVGDPDGVELSTTTGGDAGIYLRAGGRTLRLPMNETIRVWDSSMNSEIQEGPKDGEADLYASHEVFLFGYPFLTLDYRITRL